MSHHVFFRHAVIKSSSANRTQRVLGNHTPYFTIDVNGPGVMNMLKVLQMPSELSSALVLSKLRLWSGRHLTSMASMTEEAGKRGEERAKGRSSNKKADSTTPPPPASPTHFTSTVEQVMMWFGMNRCVIIVYSSIARNSDVEDLSLSSRRTQYC